MTVNILRAALLLLSAFSASASAGPASQPANLLFNGNFDSCSKAGGVPDGWEFSGDPRFVKATLSQDEGPNGGRSLRLDCTSHTPGSGWSHAMLCQVDKVKVRQDHPYTVSFWAKAKDIKDFNVQVAMQNTSPWQPLGLRQWFAPPPTWERYEFTFVAVRTCAEKSRFQISFNSTGTLWIADASIAEGSPVHGIGPQHAAHVHTAAGDGNLVPNGSFECGPSGWGSQTANYITWATPMDRLFGEVVEGGAFHGKRCLKIAINPQNQPVVNFDCYQPLRVPVKAPLAGNVGYIQLEPGQPYVLSAYLRADQDGTPVRLGVQQFGEWVNSTKVQVGREWKRYTFKFKPKRELGYVLVGPDLLESDRTSCTLWIDAVQLAKGQEPRDFAARSSSEASIATPRPGNIYFDGEKPQVIVTAANGGKAEATVRVELTVTDFWDKPSGGREVKLTVPAGGAEQQAVDSGLAKRGFYKVRAVVDGIELPEGLRIAIIPKYQRKDSMFGINHAYGWPALAEAGVNAGILWARDWSMAWQNVEPQKGRFDFKETDYQVDRAIKLGQPVLGLLPFPSSDWSSTSPATAPATRPSQVNLEHQAQAPRDIEEFKNYVARCVEHCRGRIQWWQVFNEPLYTHYSLPRDKGYRPADYVKLAQAFYESAKSADKDCKVLAGPGEWITSFPSDLQGMFEAGLLKCCDAVDLHIYPGYQRPEYLEADLVNIGQMMDRYGGRKPLWLTEHGYYADDDLNVIPPDRSRFPEVLANERIQAEFSIRFNLILLANGVQKIFYHAGTAEPLNRDQIQGIFFRYGGQPRKIYPALAAMASLFSPQVRFIKDISPALRRQRALMFQDGNRLILAAWQPFQGKSSRLKVTGAGIELRDLMGNPIPGGQSNLSTSPIFVLAEGLSAADLEKAVQISED